MFPTGIGLEQPTPGRPHLDIRPPSLPDKDFLATAERIELRPVSYSEPALPEWRTGTSSRPLIYLTLGTAFANAEALSAAGAALQIFPGELSAESVADNARKLLLRNSGYRDAARAVAEEIAQMPPPDEVARELPRWAETK